MPDFICPFCESEKFWKNGFDRGKQRYKCFECYKQIYNYCLVKSKTVPKFDFNNDIWDVRALREVEQNEVTVKIYFDKINYSWLKTSIKQYIKQEIITSNTVATATGRIIQLRPFCSYIEKQTKIQTIEEINRETILDFLNSVCRDKSNDWISHTLSTLKDFFNKGNLHRWFKVSEHLIRKEDYPKYSRGKPKDIPSTVLEQIENNLHLLPDPIARMWMVGFFCAMRISEIQLCPLDCLNQDSRGRWFITFYRKKNRDIHTLPVSRESAKIIQQQQKYIRQKFGSNFNYLFCDYLGIHCKNLNFSNFTPVSRFTKILALKNCINHLIKVKNIRDDNGELWHFTNHQLRDTRLTYLFETGHEFTVVSKWAGHKKFETTQKYVHVKDHTLREETAQIQAALLNIRGESLNPKDLPETLQTNPNAHTLAIPNDHINTPIYGYCGLSLDQDCPHWKACYTCPSFVARRELLPDYIKVRDLLREKQARAEMKGETALIDQFKQQADSLDTVIASFERVA